MIDLQILLLWRLAFTGKCSMRRLSPRWVVLPSQTTTLGDWSFFLKETRSVLKLEFISMQLTAFVCFIHAWFLTIRSFCLYLHPHSLVATLEALLPLSMWMEMGKCDNTHFIHASNATLSAGHPHQPQGGTPTFMSPGVGMTKCLWPLPCTHPQETFRKRGELQFISTCGSVREWRDFATACQSIGICVHMIVYPHSYTCAYSTYIYCTNGYAAVIAFVM